MGVLRNGFVYDDHFQILANPWILDFGHLNDIFGKPVWDFWGKGGNSYYRPLMHLANAVVHSVSGLHPFGYHLLNLLLHGAVTVLAFLFSHRLFRILNGGLPESGLPFAIFAGAVFAVHPVQSEVVSLNSTLPELLFSLFFLLGLLAFPFDGGAGDRNGSLGRVAISAACCFLALLSKETGVMLIPAIVALDLLLAPPSGAMRRPGRSLRYGMLLVPLAVYLAIRIRATGGLVPQGGGHGWTLFQTGATMVLLAGKYLWVLIAPVRLNFFHIVKPVTFAADPEFLLMATVVAGAVVLAIRSARADRLSAAGWAILVLPLLPVLYPPALASLFGEHNLYLPTLGYSILLSAFLIRGRQRGAAGRLMGVIVPIALVAGMAALTICRIPVFRDDDSLWRDVGRKLGNDAPIQFQQGYRLLQDGDLEGGIGKMKAALALYPGYPDAAYNIGVAYLQLGQDAAARVYLEMAVKEKPRDLAAHHNLAGLHYRQGRLREALIEYEAVERLSPSDPEAGRRAEAVRRMIGGSR